jgi:hypothetical protein
MILLTSSELDILFETQRFYQKKIDINDLGEATYIIDIEIHLNQSHGILDLSQKAYVKKTLIRYNI